MNILKFEPPKPQPKIAVDFSATLRELADKADAGQLDSAVVMVLADGQYTSYLPSSYQDSLVLAGLLYHRVVGKFFT